MWLVKCSSRGDEKCFGVTGAETALAVVFKRTLVLNLNEVRCRGSDEPVLSLVLSLCVSFQCFAFFVSCQYVCQERVVGCGHFYIIGPGG